MSGHSVDWRAGPPHIVDTLIAERAPAMVASAAWPLARPALDALLHYREAVRMADAVAPLSGSEALAWLSRRLSLKVEVRGLGHAPRSGRAIAVCNHPTGVADGIAVLDALRPIRPDLVFYANADALRVAPALAEVVIPVEWREAKRSRASARDTLARTRAALAAERLLVIFPAGRLARRGEHGRLADPPWAASAFTLARKFRAPILPLHLAGPSSTLFHLFDKLSGELRDITLFHELLNKRGKRFTLTIGPPVAPADLPKDPEIAAAAMKAYVETVLRAQVEPAFADPARLPFTGECLA